MQLATARSSQKRPQLKRLEAASGSGQKQSEAALAEAARSGPFWGPFSDQSKLKKLSLFLKGSWRLTGAILGAFLVVLGLSLEAWCSKMPATKHSHRMLSKSFVFAILALLDLFWRPSWLIFGGFGTKNGSPTFVKNRPKSVSVFGYFFDRSQGPFGGSTLAKKRDQTLDQFWNPLRRLPGVELLARAAFSETVEK